MTSDSARGIRGWLYAGIVAAILTWAFFHAEFVSKKKGRSYFEADRATRHVAARTHPKTSENFASLIVPNEIDTLVSPREDLDWRGYRNQESSNILATLESNPGTRLLAPEPIREVQEMLADMDQRGSHVSDQSYEAKMNLASTSHEIQTDSYPIESYKGIESTEVQRQNWPNPVSLSRQLSDFATQSEVYGKTAELEWANEVQSSLRDLDKIDRIAAPEMQLVLAKLQQLAKAVLDRPATTYSLDGSTPEEIQRRIALGLQRRTAIWTLVHRCADGSHAKLVSTPIVSPRTDRSVAFKNLNQLSHEVSRQLASTGDQAAWKSYLLLDEIAALGTSPRTNADESSRIARAFLSRVSWHRVSQDQKQLLNSPAIRELAEQLHPLAFGPVDYLQLVRDIETLEEDSIHRCRRTIAESLQSLRFSSGEAQVQLAEAINTHYRNANLRFAISKELMQTCLPAPQIIQRPVRQRILGADTQGASQIHTQLKVELIPDPQAWNIVLQLAGNVQSNTRSNRGPATFYNASNALVDTSRKIRVDVTGLDVTGSDTNVDSQDRLRGFATDFDSIPLLGDMLRQIVRQQFDQQKSLAQRIAQRTIASQTDIEFDRQISKQVSQAEKQLMQKIVDPMQDLKLNPVVVDLQTTEQRLVARYRIAGSHQMAAHSPRPLAPSDSDLSVQLHESVLNNTIEQIGLGSKTWKLPELCDAIASAFQQSDWKMPSDIPTDVSIRFADFRPITIELNQGKVQLTLRIAELSKDNSLHLERFVIRQSYVPVISGLNAHLEREGPVSIEAPQLGLGKKVEVRTVFSRIFAGHPTLPLISPNLASDPRVKGLAVSQLEIRDGWIAFAVSPRDSVHVSLIHNAQQKRVQRTARGDGLMLR